MVERLRQRLKYLAGRMATTLDDEVHRCLRGEIEERRPHRGACQWPRRHHMCGTTTLGRGQVALQHVGLDFTWQVACRPVLADPEVALLPVGTHRPALAAADLPRALPHHLHV